MIVWGGAGSIAFPSLSRMPKNQLSPRLLKKVQMQGGVTHPSGWVPGGVRGVLTPYVASPRERAGYPSGGWAPIRMGTRQMGVFQQPARAYWALDGENGKG